jgi:predicted Zn-dependent protease
MKEIAVTSRPIAGWKALRGLLAALVACSVGLLPGATAAQQGQAIVRDAETETLLRDYLNPIFKAAGIRSSSVQVFLIPSQAFNAFVANGQKIFVNTGTIIDSETPNELIGVLAHETGHLAAGDLARLRQQIDDMKTAVLIASLLGMGAAVAGAASGSEGLGGAATGILSGAPMIAQRSLLSYQRAQEAAADRAAVSYLDKTGQSGAGMLATLNRLANDNLFAARGADPYMQSHPMPRERVSTLEALVTKSKFYSRTDPPERQARHELVKAKLVGFTWSAERVNRRYPISDQGLAAKYARAISAYRHGRPGPAMKQIEGLIAASPNNPYFWELKGQALLETGQPQESVAPLRKAVSLAPSSGLIKVLLGQALVATGSRAVVDEAIKVLSSGLQSDPDVPVGYRALARAYALRDDIAMAQLATAQGLFAEGNVKEAKQHAARAQAKLKTGTPAWLRADDIVSYNPPKLK